jgi:hypothetical protein
VDNRPFSVDNSRGLWKSRTIVRFSPPISGAEAEKNPKSGFVENTVETQGKIYNNLLAVFHNPPDLPLDIFPPHLDRRRAARPQIGMQKRSPHLHSPYYEY